MKERTKRYLMAQGEILTDITEGQTEVKVNNIDDFGFDGLIEFFPTVIFMDNNTTGEIVEGEISGGELIDVLSVDVTTGIMKFRTPVKRDWLISDGAYVRRAPGGVPIKSVVIGDLSVVSNFPTVCINPTNKSIDWYTLSSTKENVSIDFLVYIENGNTEMATLELLKITDVVEWILMSNLHIKPYNESEECSVTSYAMVKNIDYGVIQKGSEFLKAAKLTWEAELHYVRDYVIGQIPYTRKY
jgi:hypothetical protein